MMNLLAVVEERVKAKLAVREQLLNTQTILSKLPLSSGERKEFEVSNMSLATKLEMLKSINE